MNPSRAIQLIWGGVNSEGELKNEKISEIIRILD